jgi:UDPglucose 6-dehydrogenase
MNELARLAERIGADIELVRKGIGSDPRIGRHFLYAGCGYGGSCFPKDVRALMRSGEEAGVHLQVLEAVDQANVRQKQVLAEKVVQRFGDELQGRRFAVWGLAFKPDTDDMREAPSRVLIRDLLARGAQVVAHDPVAMSEARRVLGPLDALSYADTPIEAAEGADALIIVTEWKAFRSPDFERLRSSMKQPVIFDGRNMLEPAMAREAGFEYLPIGRAAA